MLRSKSAVFAIALLLPTLANATTWYMKPAATGTGDCSSWANACASLATAKGKVTSNTDEIWLAKGIYKFSAEVVTDKVKVELNPPNSVYSLKIYGGFDGTETAVDFRNPAKNVVVFSGDTPVDDTSVTGGVTPSYANVGANATSRFLRFSGTGVKSASPVNILDGVTISGMHLKTTTYGGLMIENAKAEINNVKFIGNKGHAPGVYITGAFSAATLSNMVFTNNQSIDDVASSNSEIKSGAAIYAESANASLNCDYCVFTGNTATSNGGAVNVEAGVKVTIINSSFDTNSSAAGGGVSIKGPGPYFTLSSTLFNNNTSTGNGGGLYLEGIAGDILSTTFFDNKAAWLGAAIGATSSQINLQYSTIFKNKTTDTNVNPGWGLAAGVALWPDSAAMNMKANIILDNYNQVTNQPQNIWRLKTAAGVNPVITDSGYNLINFGAGAVGLSEGFPSGTYSPSVHTQVTFASMFPGAATTQTFNPTSITTVDKIVETTLKDNGGYAKSVKTAVGSVALDLIVNDLALGGVGTTPSNPFTSIAQARGVMTSYSSYDAGKYFFNLSGTTFATYVDKEGYVLVASSDSSTATAAPYTQVTVLTQRSDSILAKAIFTKLNATQIDEVRISSTSNSVSRGTFDGFSKDPDVINNLNAFKTLPNIYSDVAGAVANKGSWTVSASSLAIDYFAGASCAPGNGGAPTADSLSYSIFHACGNGASLHWIPNSSREALIDSSSVKDDLDLWVRSSQGNCNGTISTDQRGLPRADYVNPNDPNQYGNIHDCDIGGFEWNDGYQLDCWNEDGARPENNFTGGTASLCFSDPNSISPKSLIDNFGYINWQSLIMLGLMATFRFRKKMR